MARKEIGSLTHTINLTFKALAILTPVVWEVMKFFGALLYGLARVLLYIFTHPSFKRGFKNYNSTKAFRDDD